MAVIFTRTVNIQNAINNNNFGSLKNIWNIVQCSVNQKIYLKY